MPVRPAADPQFVRVLQNLPEEQRRHFAAVQIAVLDILKAICAPESPEKPLHGQPGLVEAYRTAAAVRPMLEKEAPFFRREDLGYDMLEERLMSVWGTLLSAERAADLKVTPSEVFRALIRAVRCAARLSCREPGLTGEERIRRVLDANSLHISQDISTLLLRWRDALDLIDLADRTRIDLRFAVRPNEVLTAADIIAAASQFDDKAMLAYISLVSQFSQTVLEKSGQDPKRLANLLHDRGLDMMSVSQLLTQPSSAKSAFSVIYKGLKERNNLSGIRKISAKLISEAFGSRESAELEALSVTLYSALRIVYGAVPGVLSTVIRRSGDYLPQLISAVEAFEHLYGVDIFRIEEGLESGIDAKGLVKRLKEGLSKSDFEMLGFALTSASAFLASVLISERRTERMISDLIANGIGDTETFAATAAPIFELGRAWFEAADDVDVLWANELSSMTPDEVDQKGRDAGRRIFKAFADDPQNFVPVSNGFRILFAALYIFDRFDVSEQLRTLEPVRGVTNPACADTALQCAVSISGVFAEEAAPTALN